MLNPRRAMVSTRQRNPVRRGLDPAWLEGDLAWYSSAVGRELMKPKWLLVTHLFNHQTHHRGQVHCLLTPARCQAR